MNDMMLVHQQITIVANHEVPSAIAMRGFLSSLMISLALLSINVGQIECDYGTFVEWGNSYIFQNMEYPSLYRAGSSYWWEFRSQWNLQLKIECSEVTIPSTSYCRRDRLEIQDGIQSAATFCSGKKYSYISKSSRVNVTLRSFDYPGRLHCTVQAVAPCDCGRRNTRKIHDGERTAAYEYPFMAAVMDNSTRAIICGGTIINKKQVLTAAHCIKGREPGTFGVLVGALDLDRVEDTPGAQFRFAESSIIPENYDRETAHFDIGIITIAGLFEFNEIISPICLPFQSRYDSFRHQSTDILGWGASTLMTGPLNVLMRATVNFIDGQTCKNVYSISPNEHFCTQHPTRDSCSWDSGGPLIVQQGVSRKILQIGIMNKGPACGKGEPALNLRLGPFVDWIVANTPPGITYCESE